MRIACRYPSERAASLLPFTLAILLSPAAPIPGLDFDLRVASRTDPALPNVTAAFASAAGLPRYSITEDGRFVTFSADSPNLAPGFSVVSGDVFLFDRMDESLTPISTRHDDPTVGGNQVSGMPAVSGDGSTIAFVSRATDLISEYRGGALEQIYARRLESDGILLLTHAWDDPAKGGNGASQLLSISHDGRFAYVLSSSTDLVEGYLGDGSQIYLADLETGQTSLITHAWGTPRTGSSGSIGQWAASRDGHHLVFTASEANLLPGNSGWHYQTYLFDRNFGQTSLVSHAAGSPNQYSDNSTGDVAISSDGDEVVFQSRAGNLVAGTQVTNFQIYVRSISATTTALVSSRSGEPLIGSDADSTAPSLSADGRYLTYSTFATDLFPFPVPSTGGQVVLFDLETGSRTLVTHTPSGPTAASNWGSGEALLSADGSRVVFSSTAIDLVDPPFPQTTIHRVYSFDRATGAVVLLTTNSGQIAWNGPDRTLHHSVSSDGSLVVIESNSGDLVQGDWNQATDVFVARSDGDSIRPASRRGADLPISRTANGRSYLSYPGTLSDDGRFSMFLSFAGNLAPDTSQPLVSPAWFLFDHVSNEIRPIGRGLQTSIAPLLDPSSFPSARDPQGYQFHDIRLLSSTGSVAIYSARHSEGDYFQAYAYLKDPGVDRLVSHRFSEPSKPGNGPSGAAVVSANGRFVTVESAATDLMPGYSGSGYQIYLFDLVTGDVSLISRRVGTTTTGASGWSRVLGTSFDGRWTTFWSDAADLVPGTSGGALQVYLFDASDSSVRLVSHVAGVPAKGCGLGVDLYGGSMSQDGRFVLFTSSSADLVGEAGTFVSNQAFLWDRLQSTHQLASHSTAGSTQGANNWVAALRLSRDGRHVVFLSDATNLVPGYLGTGLQVYRFDRNSGEVQLVSRSMNGPNLGAEHGAWEPSISADGSRIALVSTSRDLAPDSPSRGAHVYVYESFSDRFSVLTAPQPPFQAPLSEYDAEISADGRSVAFATQVGYLSERDWNQKIGAWDVFLATEVLPGLIFLDGFSSGDTSRWSIVAP